MFFLYARKLIGNIENFSRGFDRQVRVRIPHFAQGGGCGNDSKSIARGRSRTAACAYRKYHYSPFTLCSSCNSHISLSFSYLQRSAPTPFRGLDNTQSAAKRIHLAESVSPAAAASPPVGPQEDQETIPSPSVLQRRNTEPADFPLQHGKHRRSEADPLVCALFELLIVCVAALFCHVFLFLAVVSSLLPNFPPSRSLYLSVSVSSTCQDGVAAATASYPFQHFTEAPRPRNAVSPWSSIPPPPPASLRRNTATTATHEAPTEEDDDIAECIERNAFETHALTTALLDDHMNVPEPTAADRQRRERRDIPFDPSDPWSFLIRKDIMSASEPAFALEKVRRHQSSFFLCSCHSVCASMCDAFALLPTLPRYPVSCRDSFFTFSCVCV